MNAASFDGLPELLAEIAEVAGLEAALKIAEAKGGQRVYVPAYPRPDNWLWQAVGPEAAAKICEYFRIMNADGNVHGGRNVAVIVPLGPARSVLKQAKRKLREHLKNGVSVRESARRAGLHERTGFYAAKRLRAESERAEAEPTLFDALKAPGAPRARKKAKG